METKTMTFTEAKATAEALHTEYKTTGRALDAFPKGPMGFAPDAVRATPEWKAAKARADAAFAKLRAFNAVYVKTFAKELREERDARRNPSR